MDFQQKTLTRAEWESIETPIPDNEKNVCRLICAGFHNPDIRENAHKSLVLFMKIQPSKSLDHTLFQTYFQPIAERVFQHFSGTPRPATLAAWLSLPKQTQVKLSGADKIRLQHLDDTISKSSAEIFEFLLLDLCLQYVGAPKTDTKSSKKDGKDNKKIAIGNHNPIVSLYTLCRLKHSSIHHINPFVSALVDRIINHGKSTYTAEDVLFNAYECIEKNPLLIQYEDRTLYSHQRDLFRICKEAPREPKLVLYIAPTGTGKTLSPIGLVEDATGMGGFRVIFVCVARHVAFALAQSAISAGKKIATAFGCTAQDGIRLHNSAADVFVRNKRSGGIGKIDHTKGELVELMICDVQSYLHAMRYMLEFNEADNMITFWDEPTITMDKEIISGPLGKEPCSDQKEPCSDQKEPCSDQKELCSDQKEPCSDQKELCSDQKELRSDILHEVIMGETVTADAPTIAQLIHANWAENRIPNMVLSCATLPTEAEIAPVLADFRAKFKGAKVHSITSVDCKKSIGLLDSKGYVILPHTLFADYDELQQCVQYCEQDLTVLRYFDLTQIVVFIRTLRMHNWMPIFGPFDLGQIGLLQVKQYYLNVLRCVPRDEWPELYEANISARTLRYPPSIVGSGDAIRKTHSDTQLPGHSGGRPITKTHSVDSLSMTNRTPLSSHVGTNPFSGVLLTTADAHTLTDGPTLYLAENVDKLCQFYISQSHISDAVFQNIQAKIQHNDALAKQIAVLEQELGDGGDVKEDVVAKDNSQLEHIQAKYAQISLLMSQVCNVSLDPLYVPNHPTHLQKWWPSSDQVTRLNQGTPVQLGTPYYRPLDDQVVRKIMGLDIQSNLKILLLMGIGVFAGNQPTGTETKVASDPHFHYLEIMKQLANTQRLYLIIACSDYIYGTNYQSCHGFIGKDLDQMTQQKLKQSLGRIGRQNVQQEYTVRFRNDEHIKMLWKHPARNLEAENMCRLFSSQ